MKQILKTIVFFVCIISTTTFAQKPVVLVLPFPPGGPTDQVARVIQHTLSQELKRPVVIEHRPGAGGTVASSYVSKWSSTDPVILLQSSSYVINLALHNQLTHWNESGIVPLLYIGKMPMIMVVSKHSQLTDLSSWTKLDSTTPIPWGSAGVGTMSHLTGAVFKDKIKKNLIHIPYKGSSPLVIDLIAKHVEVAFVTATPAEIQMIKNNQMIAVATSASQRIKGLEKLPTFQESGLRSMNYHNWWILLTSQHVSAVDQKKIQSAMIKILSNKRTSELYQELGLELDPTPISQAFILKEMHKYQEVTRLLKD
jgi:tripartite-type tricarboxylate transporter receptor subunit TctC